MCCGLSPVKSKGTETWQLRVSDDGYIPHSSRWKLYHNKASQDRQFILISCLVCQSGYSSHVVGHRLAFPVVCLCQEVLCPG
ncbi:Hypp1257 [Branchiostoma lanceolatum]|uniref:Hypp1257 protein n=1 Tax=Branchiostoma lanceolatum TaxID=7740 RepID=A0A8J9ZIX3_BRALA|nr:Hypp1257 [Branchiostoma lanceolatum]